MKITARACSPAHIGFFILTLLTSIALGLAHAQNEPILVPDAVDYQKLLPILPESPSGWTADKPEGSTEDVGGFIIRISNRIEYANRRGRCFVAFALAVVAMYVCDSESSDVFSGTLRFISGPA